MSKKINREKSTKKEDIFMNNFNERDYAQGIIEMVKKIKNLSILKRIYQLTEYLYIHKTEKE